MKWKKFALIFGLVLLTVSAVLTGSALHGKKVATEGYLFFVSHTEYWSVDDTGQTIVRLQDFKGNPITANWCNTTIYYPNKTVYINNFPMIATAIAGNYYMNFTPPVEEGIYEEFVNCSYGSPQRFISTSESFHVNPALNLLKEINVTVKEVNETTHHINESIYVLNDTANNIYTDTQWMRSNLVNATSFDDWKNNVTVRFDNVDGNLTVLKGYCNTSETNSSALCQKIYEMNAFIEAQNITFTNYFENITTTTTNIWDYMTGTLFIKLNDTYNLLFQVNQTVTDIKTNVTDIRQDQIDEVHINIIS